MRRSTSRILTTHTGSLPRPRELTRLYALRARGETVDAADIERSGRDAVRSVVRKQQDAGTDVERYPDFKRMWIEQHASKTQVSAIGGLPKAIGEVRYLDARAIDDECGD